LINLRDRAKTVVSQMSVCYAAGVLGRCIISIEHV